MKEYAKAAWSLFLLITAFASAAQALEAPLRGQISPVVPVQATLFPLEDVRLLPSPFLNAQETDHAYLLRLDPDRLLSAMRLSAGLTPKAPTYGGWDSGGAGSVGHYLSAVSQMAQGDGRPGAAQAHGLYRV